MRVIRRRDLRDGLPAAWVQKAEAASAELQLKYEKSLPSRAVDPRRWRTEWSQTVEGLKSIWQDSELKEVFVRASNGKCWYCEANVLQRSDVPIDHFRPKNRVHEDNTHEGYWWLACDWKNYRYACTYCNSRRNTDETTGGKQDQFPIWDEKHRARWPDGATQNERPLLLDPLVPADVLLLHFERTGLPVPAVDKNVNAFQHERAQTSIRVFHLDRPAFNGLRRSIMSRMEEHLEEADRQARYLDDPANVAADFAYNHALESLMDFLDPKAEFSGAARAFLGSMRGSSETARKIYSGIAA